MSKSSLSQTSVTLYQIVNFSGVSHHNKFERNWFMNVWPKACVKLSFFLFVKSVHKVLSFEYCPYTGRQVMFIEQSSPNRTPKFHQNQWELCKITVTKVYTYSFLCDLEWKSRSFRLALKYGLQDWLSYEEWTVYIFPLLYTISTAVIISLYWRIHTKLWQNDVHLQIFQHHIKFYFDQLRIVHKSVPYRVCFPLTIGPSDKAGVAESGTKRYRSMMLINTEGIKLFIRKFTVLSLLISLPSMSANWQDNTSEYKDLYVTYIDK